MIKKISIEQIHPYVRYARFLELNRELGYPPYIPYDCRLFYAYKGTGEIIVDGKLYKMPKGSLMIFQSDTPYNLLNEQAVVYLAFNFDFTYEHFKNNQPIPPDTLNLYQPKLVLERIDFLDCDPFNGIIYLNNMEVIEKDLLEIESEFRHRRLYYNNKISTRLSDIIINVARRISFIEPKAKNCAIDDIIDYIQLHYSEDLTNQDIGRMFNFHPNYINSLVVGQTGLSLHQYVLSLKISKAIELLEATDMPINQISDAVGFNDICHFSRYFRKITGRKPRDFRIHDHSDN